MAICEMQKHLTTKSLGRNCFFFNSIDSTSSYIRSMWKALSDGHTVVASEQHSGRGRSGKSFFSPKENGLYFSFILKGKEYLDDSLFTIKMSYAVCEAIDSVTGTDSIKIKWVNDIYQGNKKLAGILCEALNDGQDRAVIVGVGVNLKVDRATVPQGIKNIIGSIRDVTKKSVSAEKLCAEILNKTEVLFSSGISDSEFIAMYRDRSAVLGKEISVLKNNEEMRAAALDIAEDGGLLVRYENGVTEKLTAGEISILI